MKSKTYTRQMITVLLIISWIIFIGLSIEAGGFTVGAFFAVVNPSFIKNLWIWQEVDLSALYHYDHRQFFGITLLMSIVAFLKALLFYLIIRLLHDKKLDISNPFNKVLGRFIFNMSYLSLFIGVIAWIGNNYKVWLTTQGVNMPDIQDLRFDGYDIWLFMGITLVIIAQMFKRGIEIQSENDLTI